MISYFASFSASLARTIMDITYDNIVEIMEKGHDIKNFWYQWYLSYGFAYDMAWYVSMILRTSDIIALWYHLLLWYHVTCTVSWCWLGAPLARSSAFSGLAAANKLGTGVQLNSNGLDPPHGPVAVDVARVVSGGRLVVVKKLKKLARCCRCCWQCSPCRHSANAPRQMTLVRQVPGRIKSSSWIQVVNWQEVQGGGWERPSRQPGHSESCVSDDCVHASKQSPRLPQYIYRYARARHCTRANNCETTIQGHCKII